jgi:thioredoxin-dependent peroxiredoxin
MATREGLVTLKGNPIGICGNEVNAGASAPDATLVANDLSEQKISDHAGKVVILSVVPSLDTGICDTSTRRFNEEAAGLGDDVVILTVSRDLPFAQTRWCGAAGVEQVVTLSDFRTGEFGENYGLIIADGPLAGVLARAVLVIGKDGVIAYQELVPEIAQEPNYDAALAAAKAAL